mmetsp:Transcript_19790/g.44610  ORF Transcript_19790/g.44610 Transcript_19790/m.44610 type:complete len:306 (+) Transcript_19790:400-1317(+)
MGPATQGRQYQGLHPGSGALGEDPVDYVLHGLTLRGAGIAAVLPPLRAGREADPEDVDPQGGLQPSTTLCEWPTQESHVRSVDQAASVDGVLQGAMDLGLYPLEHLVVARAQEQLVVAPVQTAHMSGLAEGAVAYQGHAPALLLGAPQQRSTSIEHVAVRDTRKLGPSALARLLVSQRRLHVEPRDWASEVLAIHLHGRGEAVVARRPILPLQARLRRAHKDCSTQKGGRLRALRSPRCQELATCRFQPAPVAHARVEAPQGLEIGLQKRFVIEGRQFIRLPAPEHLPPPADCGASSPEHPPGCG